jgi:hypothetical protein
MKVIDISKIEEMRNMHNETQRENNLEGESEEIVEKLAR